MKVNYLYLLLRDLESINLYSEKNKFIKKIYLSDISSKGDCFIRFENKYSIMIEPLTEKLIIKSSSVS